MKQQKHNPFSVLVHRPVLKQEDKTYQELKKAMQRFAEEQKKQEHGR